MSFPISIDSFEKQNVISFQGAWRSRKAFYSHLTPTSGTVFVAGFSVEMANTGEVVHYLLERSTTTGVGTLYCKDEQYSTISSIALGTIPKQVVLTHAVIARQILINGPHLPFPIYGLVGGGMIVATAQASVIPSTTAIPVPLGICCEFGGRVAVAQGSSVHFSDPGIEPRTFVGENVLALPATIYDLYVGPNGMLIMGTADGVYALPSDAAGQGQLTYGFVSKLSPYQSRQYRNTCYSQGRLLGLTQNGVTELGQTLSSVPLVTYAGKRYRSRYVGPGMQGDYRVGSIWQTQDNGAMISINDSICAVEIQQGLSATWYTSGQALEIVGICSNDVGMDLVLTPGFLLESWGNDEFNDNDFAAVCCGTVALDPANSTLVRHVTTSSDNVGESQTLYVGGAAKTATTPAASRQANIIGTSVWSSSANFSAPEMRSRRHHVVLRTDEFTLEVGVTGALSAIGDIDIDTKNNVSPKRPTN